MCNICNKQEARFAMTGLAGRMCTSCHDAILQARKGNTESAKEYFSNINLQSEEARKFVENELRESEMRPAPVKRVESTELLSEQANTSIDSQSDNSQILNKIVSDINTIKSILIFFLIITFIGLGGTLLYVIQIVNTFKDLF